jgi:RimJ/RimL family protein N-acetyltransferase
MECRAAMVQIESSAVTPELNALFDPDAPAALRFFAVLEGADPGKILTDNPHHPNWGAVWEAGDGILFLGGKLDAPIINALVSTFRHNGEVLVPFWELHDAIVNLLPPNPSWTGSSIDFLDRSSDKNNLEAYLCQMPSGFTIHKINHDLLKRCHWYEDTVRRHGSAHAFLERGLGFCLMAGDEIICEAYAGKAINGTRELGATTKEQYRGRGYATITCAHLIHACELAGARTYWNCATTNLASVAIARKLGYQTEKEFQWWAWSQIN